MDQKQISDVDPYEQKQITKLEFSLHDLLLTPMYQERPNNDYSPLHQKNDDAEALLKSLGLYKKYPKGLHIQDAQICMELPKLDEKPLQISDDSESLVQLSDNSKHLPYLLILNKLMSYDSQCRSILFSVKSHDQDSSDCDNESESSDDSYQFSDGISPVDCLLSLVISSDITLQQDLFFRLISCQFAVPFIIQDPFTKKLTLPLWGLRSIIKEWEHNPQKGETKKISIPIVTQALPIVSFIRLGKHLNNVSKSKILNEVISNHDHFFHYNCNGGDRKIVFGEGLVDMCWYLPSKTSDAFPHAITFLNLHGDARAHPEQTRFLSQISSICFVLLTEKNINLNEDITQSMLNFEKSAGGIVTLKRKRISDCLNSKQTIEIKKQINIPEIKRCIHKQINTETVLDVNKCKSLETWCTCAGEASILVDEHNELYSQLLEEANIVKTIITEQSSQPVHRSIHGKSYVKDILLPLQGEQLWRAWASKNKEKFRQIQRGNKLMNEYTEEIRSEMSTIRKMQLKHVETLTPLMQSFITSLLKLTGPSNKPLRNFFLQTLKLYLNHLSRESISAMRQEYHSERIKFNILQKKDDRGNLIDLKKKLEELQQDIINSSLGLEHLLRELSQVYESVLESEQYLNSLRRLPKAAAELLIDGYPVELMDGDAVHVPLQWVSAVLTETVKILDNPMIFVLSVLGLQSTGKSTLLNTVFGVQFNVSAGRCTRGIFMQLLPLNEKLRMQTNISYILLIDTEGLRAPLPNHLVTQKHDNELATFVIGLANMTIINIMGEVPADMNDILQTSVHAFLRMSQVKLNPSCQFVHQNASASKNSDIEQVEFAKKLDEFTIEAAQEEHCEEKFKCFNDVIKFNAQTDIHYFPGLWKGDPPMAPVNPGYSHAAQMLKTHLIKLIRERILSKEQGSDFHLLAFQKKVKDLWNALLKENFVFSFRNTQEITAYNLLETNYSSWDWELQVAMKTWEQEAENEISTIEPKSALKKAQEKCTELKGFISTLHKSLATKMEKIFTDSKEKDILVQWKGNFQKRLEININNVELHAIKYCNELGKSREAICKFDEIKKNHVAIITGKIQDHIAHIKKEQESIIENLTNKTLTKDQQDKIFERELFTSENLKFFLEQRVIREDQVQFLQLFIDDRGGHMAVKDVNMVMFKHILEKEQIKRLLVICGRQSEKELKEKFDSIWDELIEQLPPVSIDEPDIELEAQNSMESYFRRHSQNLKEVLSAKSIIEWGSELKLIPVESIHYTVPLSYKTKVSAATVGAYLNPTNWGYKSKITTDGSLANATEITVKVFYKAKEFIGKQSKQNTNFKAIFIHELLKEVHDTIEIESEAVKDCLTFTDKYRLTVSLIVCGYAIPQFKRMAKLFRERLDPKLYLEKHVKQVLFAKFKSQYHQLEAEEAIANIFCAHLEAPIKEQITQTICTVVVRKMKTSKHYFTSKMALKVKVLVDLHRYNDFDEFMAYIRNIKEYYNNQIKKYTLEFCDEKISSETRLQIASKEEVDRLIYIVDNTISEVNETEIQEWLAAFSNHQSISKNLGFLNFDNLLTGFDTLKQINLQNFKQQIRIRLEILKKNLHDSCQYIQCRKFMASWKNQPYELLSNLIGCTEQCPFCKEQCDLLDHKDNTEKHRVEIHRPSCLAGYRNIETQIMVSRFCTASVSTDIPFRNDKTGGKDHPYKQYNSIYPEWSIPPDSAAETSLYWKWFVGKYTDELAEIYEAEPADVPDSWRNITWPEVVRNLEETYNVQVEI